MFTTQINQLAEGLDARGIPFTMNSIFNGWQIVADGWDAVCHGFSYGHENDLLEIMGSIVRCDDDDVEGYLTAEDILNRL